MAVSIGTFARIRRDRNMRHLSCHVIQNEFPCSTNMLLKKSNELNTLKFLLRQTSFSQVVEPSLLLSLELYSMSLLCSEARNAYSAYLNSSAYTDNWSRLNKF